MTCSSHKLIIIAVKRKTFLDLLFYVTVYHRIRFATTRRTQHKAGTERVHDIYPAIIPFLLIVEPGRQIYGILVLDKPCFLLETLVRRLSTQRLTAFHSGRFPGTRPRTGRTSLPVSGSPLIPSVSTLLAMNLFITSSANS